MTQNMFFNVFFGNMLADFFWQNCKNFTMCFYHCASTTDCWYLDMLMYDTPCTFQTIYFLKLLYCHILSSDLTHLFLLEYFLNALSAFGRLGWTAWLVFGCGSPGLAAIRWQVPLLALEDKGALGSTSICWVKNAGPRQLLRASSAMSRRWAKKRGACLQWRSSARFRPAMGGTCSPSH